MTKEGRYFGTDGIRGPVGHWPITPEFFLRLGFAVGHLLQQEGARKIVVGRDTRVSGALLEAAFNAGAMSAGMQCLSAGVVPTPAVAYLTKSLHADMGVVISASHNPYTDNGIKFFSHTGMKISDAFESAIEQLLHEPLNPEIYPFTGTTSIIEDAAGRYIEFCKSAFDPSVDLKHLKIVVDGANGALSRIAPTLLSEMGADVILMHCDPDGLNINKSCGSTHITPLQAAVVAEAADLGIAVDGDGDRLLMVDHSGSVVDGDELLLLMTLWYQRRGLLKGGVVGTLMSNCGLEQSLKEANIAFTRSGVGDRFVLEALSQRQWMLGGETSGHLICLDISTTGDAMVACGRILSALCHENKSLYELKQGMQKWPQVMINIRVANGPQLVKQPQVLARVAEIEQALEGKGRVVLRPSGTEPLVRVMVEAKDFEVAKECAQILADCILECAR